MSQQNVDLATALIPPPDTDFAALLRDDASFAQMSAALTPFLTDDFQSVVIFGGQTNTATGTEGFRQNWLDWLQPWATYRTMLEEAIDLGDRALLLLRNYGRREGMDAEVGLIGAAICTIRGGKVARWEDYADRAAALEAAGLSEQAMSQENVEIVRALLAALSPSFDLDAAAELWDRDISWRAIEGALDDVGEMRGRPALRSYYEQWKETFDPLRAEVVELRPARGAVVAAALITGRMKGSDSEVEMCIGVVYELRDGKVIRGREYATFEEALQAVGLSE